METLAKTAALNPAGFPTLVLVPLLMVVTIASVIGVIWLYKKLNKRK